MKPLIDTLGKGDSYAEPVATDHAPAWATRLRLRKEKARLRKAGQRAARRVMKARLAQGRDDE